MNRDRTIRHALSAAGAIMLAAAAHAQSDPARTATARGTVFLDRNADGVRQTGEPGVPGVGVTNGHAVIRTDERGRYQIEIDARDAIVSVIKPRDHRVRIDDRGIPRGYYIHKPDGSPDDGFVFPGVEPTGPLPESIDFPLTRDDDPESFTVLVLADPQAYSLQQIDYFRREVVDRVATTRGNTAGAHFGVTVGDLVGDNLDLFEPLNQAQALFGVPWYNVAGNHDINFMAGRSAATSDHPDRHADETFERVYGPPDYAFQYADAHFIVLDNVRWQGFDGFAGATPNDWPADRKPSTGNYRGGVGDRQLEFVDNYLELVPPDDLVVLLFHIPIEMDGPGVHRIPEQRRLFEILSSHPRTLSVSGHTHFQRHWFFGDEHGYRPETNPGANQLHAADPRRFPAPVHHHINSGTISGSWFNGVLDETGTPHTTMRDGAPNGYTLLRIDGAEYRSDYVPAREPDAHAMSIHIASNTDAPDTTGGAMPDALVRGEGDATITVNVFNGAEGDAVSMRIRPAPDTGAGPTPWRDLAFNPGIDPYYRELYAREGRLPPGPLTTGWGLPEPVASHHLWTGSMPGDLPTGTHMVEIRHTDMYGRTSLARKSFRVAE